MGFEALMCDLERAVMERLWSATEPQTVRQVHASLPAHRALYAEIAEALRRLVAKRFAVQSRDGGVHRYAPSRSREDLAAQLLLKALHRSAHVVDDDTRAIVHLTDLIGVDDAWAVRHALAGLDSKRLDRA